MSRFATAMADTATTWNGAKSLATPDIPDTHDKINGRMALFFKSVRGLNLPRLYEYLRESANESLIDTFLLAFHIRDCRGGKGERELGRSALCWLFINYPDQFERVMPLMAEYGRWDDILELFPGVLDLDNICANYASNIEGEAVLGRLRELQTKTVCLLGQKLVNDLVLMEQGKPISICAKWVPTEKDSYDRKFSTVKTICETMGWSPRNYRKTIVTPLRQYLHIVERYMCESLWYEIEYSKVPSCAMKRLKKAFEKHAPETFASWKAKLWKGDVEVKAKQLQPHELVYEVRTKNAADTICEAQWKVLEEDVKKLGALSNALCVVDVSGSMESFGDGCGRRGKSTPSFSPIDVSIALGIIISNAVEGAFKNHMISFHETPTFTVLEAGSFYDRYLQVKAVPWGGSTNLQATFDLILNHAKKHNLTQKDMPKRLFIISDMQFNVVEESNGYYHNSSHKGPTNFQAVDQKFKSTGYERPQIVFWNVNGQSTDFPVSVGDNGTVLISGFSPAVIEAILNGKDFSPWTALRDTLDSKRYEPVRDALDLLDDESNVVRD